MLTGMSNRRVKKACLQCKKSFNSYICDNRKFCCRDCANQHRTTKQLVNCHNCKISFSKIFSEVKRSKRNFCSLKCYYEKNTHTSHSGYKGGSISESGYKVIYVDKVKIFEHRHVVECHLGRKLTEDEIIHHINEDKLDNRIENLLVTSRLKHGNFHLLKKWARNYDYCVCCGSNERKHDYKGYCSRCSNYLRKKKMTPS